MRRRKHQEQGRRGHSRSVCNLDPSWCPQIRREKLPFLGCVTLRASIPCHFRLLCSACRGRKHQQDHQTSGSFHNQVLPTLCKAVVAPFNAKRDEIATCCARHHRPRHGAPEPRDECPSFHWITSSAVANSVSGMVRPSALAVFKLMTSRTFTGCCTGRSAGFSPLRMRPT